MELALNEGRCLLTGGELGTPSAPLAGMTCFDDVLQSGALQLHYVCDRLVCLVNAVDASHAAHRRYPLMSLFIDDCVARGLDVCAGGAQYNLTGCIVPDL